MTIRLYLLDDHELVREGLRAVLGRQDDIDIVGEAATARDGLADIVTLRPDVALIEPRLPDGDGIALCRSIRERFPSVACLILTSYSNDDILLSAIRADAAGFVAKRAGITDLIRSIRLVAAGESLIDSDLQRHLLDRLQADTLETEADRSLGMLSPQERRLLDHLAEGLTNRQVAEQMGLAEKTVKNYVSNLLRKLDMSSRTEAAVFVTNLRLDRKQRAAMDDHSPRAELRVRP
ncbi:MAG: response regulator transcription factor [Actinomycetota bacterium]